MLSLVILSSLVAIGVGIFMAQYRFNPGVLQLKADLPPATKTTTSSPVNSAEPLLMLPDGIAPLSPPEIFEANNLSDKINGKAEFYLAAGFVRLLSQRFKDERAGDFWIEAFVYDMGNGRNAFSVFSAQRREGAEPLDLAQYSYMTQNALFLVHGSYYVEIIASEASERAFYPMKLFAENFINNTRTETITIQEQELFPKQDLVANSVTLISSDAFGFDRLNQVYTAEYKSGNRRLMAFLSRRRNPQEAKELSSAYEEFLVTFGGQTLETELPIKDAQLMEILETYEVIFSCGAFLAGIREAEDLELAKNLAIRLFEKLKEATGES